VIVSLDADADLCFDCHLTPPVLFAANDFQHPAVRIELSHLKIRQYLPDESISGGGPLKAAHAVKDRYWMTVAIISDSRVLTFRPCSLTRTYSAEIPRVRRQPPASTHIVAVCK
ncbi:MAG: hypothetical protein VB092_08595, partial [Oscillospiraceae bacterium]|nr:hypothetical protein [Oscillospiraceae bacterium]